MLQAFEDAPPLLEVSVVARRINASHEFVRRLIRGKQLTAVHIGRRWRIERADVDAFIKARVVHAAER